MIPWYEHIDLDGHLPDLLTIAIELESILEILSNRYGDLCFLRSRVRSFGTTTHVW